MVTSCPIFRSAATSALSRKQLPQYIAPAPGVSWTMFILALKALKALKR
jgi:hypothetical protein